MLKLKKFRIPIDADLEEHSIIEETKYDWKWTAAGPPGDAVILEHYLIREKMVHKPDSWRHDFQYGDHKVDCKEIGDKYFNIQHGKTEQYMESIALGQLTHFLFWTSDRPADRRLYAGDVLNIEILGYCDARKVLKSRLVSLYPGKTEAYVRLASIQMLDEGLKYELQR